jgi:tetratricopeptide (TPR) repeat protein
LDLGKLATPSVTQMGKVLVRNIPAVMTKSWPRPALVPWVLACGGAAFSILAALDKVFGLVQRPLHLATLAYALLALLLIWTFLRGVHLPAARLYRLSVYAAFLILNVLTATYIFAWRVSADPTPLVLQSQLARGDHLLAQGEEDEAHLLYLDAQKRYPNSFAVLMRLGAVNYQIGNHSRAARYFSNAVDVAPGDSRWRALKDLGQTYWKMERPEEAIEMYEAAGKAGMPQSELLEWHYRLAWAYFDARDFDRSLEHYLIVAREGRKYTAASYYNAACAQAQQIILTADPAKQRTLTQDAVENLRRAWRSTTTPDEVNALREGLIGDDGERDPELEPLRGAPEFEQFIAEIGAA